MSAVDRIANHVEKHLGKNWIQVVKKEGKDDRGHYVYGWWITLLNSLTIYLGSSEQKAKVTIERIARERNRVISRIVTDE